MNIYNTLHSIYYFFQQSIAANLVSRHPRLPFGTYFQRLSYPTRVATASTAAYNEAVAAYLGGRDDKDVKFFGCNT